MPRKLRLMLRGMLYVQVWEKRLKVTNLVTGNVFDEPPFVVIKMSASSGRRVVAVGDQISTTMEYDTFSCNPFSHPRMLLADLAVAQHVLNYAFKKTRSSSFFAPVVIIHPMEKVEGDLTTLERNGFISVAKRAGAKEVITYVGAAVSGEALKGLYTGELRAADLE